MHVLRCVNACVTLNTYIQHNQNNQNFITHKAEKYFKTDYEQQKRRKQLILIDNNNILTYSFKQRHHIKSDFMAAYITIFICTAQNKDDTKLRIFSFKPQKQRIHTTKFYD